MTIFVTFMSITFLFIACATSALLVCFSKKFRKIADYITANNITRYRWLIIALLVMSILVNILGIGTIMTL